MDGLPLPLGNWLNHHNGTLFAGLLISLATCTLIVFLDLLGKENDWPRVDSFRGLSIHCNIYFVVIAFQALIVAFIGFKLRENIQGAWLTTFFVVLGGSAYSSAVVGVAAMAESDKSYLHALKGIRTHIVEDFQRNRKLLQQDLLDSIVREVENLGRSRVDGLWNTLAANSSPELTARQLTQRQAAQAIVDKVLDSEGGNYDGVWRWYCSEVANPLRRGRLSPRKLIRR